MIELAFLKELMLIRQADQKSDICPYWYTLSKGFRLHSQRSAMHGADYRCIISGFNKSEAINLLQNIDLPERRET